MTLMVRETQRGPSSLLSYILIKEEFSYYQHEEESEDVIVIDKLVEVKALTKLTARISFDSFVAFRKLKTEENVSIILRVSCENPAFDENWICTESWSRWKKIGVKTLDIYPINGEGYDMCYLQIKVSVRKIEKSDLCTKMYLDADFTDFILSAENGSVAVHKIVMASHSDVFKAMLNGEWKETIEGQIEVKGTTRECLEHLKDYMYLDILPDEGLCPLLLLALRYMIRNLKTRCIRKLTDSVTSENLFKLLEFACSNNIPELAFEIMHSTPSKIVDKAYKSKKTTRTGTLRELADTSTDKK